MSTFTLDLQRFAEKAGKKADDLVGQVVADVVARVDMRSPVGNPALWKHKPPAGYVGGRFRANWDLTIGAPSNVVTERIDPSGAATVTGNLAVIPEHAAGNVYYLTNNVPYSVRIEDGWSTQAPSGVVGLTAIEWQSIVDKSAKGMK